MTDTIRVDGPMPNGLYCAVDDDTYDGAPDGRREMGWGKTPEAARADLIEIMRENDIDADEARAEEWRWHLDNVVGE